MKLLLLIVLVGVGIYIGSTTSEIKRVTKMRMNNTLVDKWLGIMEQLEISNCEVVLAQAILETGNFKSKILRENRNHFGMKYNKRGHCMGTRYGHCYYQSDIDSYIDYKEWQDAMLDGRVLTNAEYLLELNCMTRRWNKRYAEDPLYTDKLKILITKIQACRSRDTLEIGTAK